MDATPAALRPARACAWCGQPLGRLRAMRRDVCERPSCLAQFDERTLRTAQAQAAQALRARAVPALGPARAAATQVVWLVEHDATLVPLPDELRDQQAQHLLSLAGPDHLLATSTAAEPPAPAGVAHWAEGRLCAWCSGRCCRFGGENHAYIEGRHLQRWAAAHDAATLADAAQAYIDRLPARHVEGSCPYHGDKGCALDRDMRSETCNRFACDALRNVQTRSTHDEASDWLFVMGPRADVDRVVLATRDSTGPLPDAETP